MGLAFGSGDNTAQISVVVADAGQHGDDARRYIDHVLRSLSLGPAVEPSSAPPIRRVGRSCMPTSTACRPSIALIRRSSRLIDAATSARRSTWTASAHPTARQGRRRRLRGRYRSSRGDHRGHRRARRSRERRRNEPRRARRRRSPRFGAPPAVPLADDAVRRDAAGSPLGYLAPSMAIVFLFLSVGAAASSMLAERSLGTMVRLQAAPVGIGRSGGRQDAEHRRPHAAERVVAVGCDVRRVRRPLGRPGAVVALLLATVAAVAAIGHWPFITVSARDAKPPRRRPPPVSAFVLALLGGNFFPPGSLPPALEKAVAAHAERVGAR